MKNKIFKIGFVMLLIVMLSNIAFSLNDPIVWYGMDADGYSGSTMFDLSDVDGLNNATIFGSVYVPNSTGVVNEGFYTGLGKTFGLRIDDYLADGESFTIGGWFNNPAIANGEYFFSGGTGSSIGFRSFTLDVTSNKLRLIHYITPSASVITSSTITYNYNAWNLIVLKYDKPSQYIEVWRNNVLEINASLGGDLINLNGATIYMNKLYTFDSSVEGYVDELFYYNRTLSSTELTTLLNSSASNGYRPSFEPAVEPPKESTSLKSASTNIVDDSGILISSSAYSLIGNFSFNLTNTTDIYIKGSGYIQPTSNSLHNLYLKIENSEILLDEKVSSIDSTLKYRQFNIPVLKYSGTAGENNILVYGKKDGAGNINLYNLDFILDTNITENSTTKVYQFSGSKNISSTSLTKVYDYSFNKETSTSNYMGDSSIKLTSYSGGVNKITCVYQFNGINVTSPMERSLNYLGDVGSMGVSGFVNGSSNPTIDVNLSLYCYGSTTGDFGVDAYDTIQMLEAENNKLINGKIGYESFVVALAGVNNILSLNYTPVNSTRVNIPFSMTLLSASGSQEGVKTPIISAYVEGLACEEIHLRSLDSIIDYASVKGILNCDGLTIGANSTIKIDLEVGVAEDIIATEVSASVYEVSELDITSTPPPISNIILNPITDETIEGSYIFTQSVNEQTGNGFDSYLLLYTENGTLYETLYNDSNTTNITTFNFESLEYPNGNYYIYWFVDNGVTSDFDTTDFIINNIVIDQSIEMFTCNTETGSMLFLMFIIVLLLIFMVICYALRWNYIGALMSFLLFPVSLYLFACWSVATFFFFCLAIIMTIKFTGREFN